MHTQTSSNRCATPRPNGSLQIRELSCPILRYPDAPSNFETRAADPLQQLSKNQLSLSAPVRPTSRSNLSDIERASRRPLLTNRALQAR